MFPHDGFFVIRTSTEVNQRHHDRIDAHIEQGREGPHGRQQRGQDDADGHRALEAPVVAGVVPGMAEHVENEIGDDLHRDYERGQRGDDHPGRKHHRPLEFKAPGERPQQHPARLVDRIDPCMVGQRVQGEAAGDDDAQGTGAVNDSPG